MESVNNTLPKKQSRTALLGLFVWGAMQKTKPTDTHQT
jgi:hypothetical protein